MTKPKDLGAGDTAGDTLNVKPADSPRRRRKKSKTPARLPGCEHRWFPFDGWLFRSRQKVEGKVQVGKWVSREKAKEEAAAKRGRRAEVGDVPIDGEAEPLVTLFDGCQAVLDTVRERPGTWRGYHEHFQTLCRVLGAKTPLQQIDARAVETFVVTRRAERHRGAPPSELRIRKDIGALNRVFRLAIRRRVFTGANPLDQVERPKAQRKHASVFDVDELGELFSALRRKATPHDLAVVAALLFTGMRREALCHVMVRDIDDQAGFIRDLKQKRSQGGIVPITKPLAHVLPILRAAADTDGHLIPAGTQRGPRVKGREPSTPTERRVGAVVRAFRRCREHLPQALRGRFHPHTMRHSLRTLLADAAVPEHVRNAITDHAPENVGRSYEHASPTKVRHYATQVLDPLLWMVDKSTRRPKAKAE